MLSDMLFGTVSAANAQPCLDCCANASTERNTDFACYLTHISLFLYFFRPFFCAGTA